MPCSPSAEEVSLNEEEEEFTLTCRLLSRAVKNDSPKAPNPGEVVFIEESVAGERSSWGYLNDDESIFPTLDSKASVAVAATLAACDAAAVAFNLLLASLS